MVKESVKDKNINEYKRKMIKRTSKKKLLGYKVKILIKSIIIILLVVLIGLILSFMIFFKVKKIEAKESAYYTQDEIIKSSAINKNDNIFFLNAYKIQKNIEKNLPYIEKATLQKNIPDKVTILIEDAKLRGLIVKDDGTEIGVSQGGKVLGPVEDKNDDVFYIEGVKYKGLEVGEKLKCEDEFTEKVLLSLLSIIEEGKLKNITKIDLSNLTRITLEYQNRISINIGSFENVDYKIRTASEIIYNKIENNESGTLNLSRLDKDSKSYFSPNIIK